MNLKTVAWVSFGLGAVGGLWIWNQQKKLSPSTENKKVKPTFTEFIKGSSDNTPVASSMNPTSNISESIIPDKSNPGQIVLGNKQTWKDNVATSIAQKIFGQSYGGDPMDERRVLLIGPDGTVPATKGPFRPDRPWLGKEVFAFAPGDKTHYYVSNQDGSEFWVLQEENVPEIAGPYQSKFAVLAYPATIQTVLGPDSAFKLS
jgi:hypothetical protein